MSLSFATFDLEDDGLRLLVEVDLDLSAVPELAEHDLVDERLLDLVPDDPRDGASSELLLGSLVDYVLLDLVGESDLDVLRFELRSRSPLFDELVDDLLEHANVETVEFDDCVEPVPEFWRERR